MSSCKSMFVQLCALVQLCMLVQTWHLPIRLVLPAEHIDNIIFQHTFNYLLLTGTLIQWLYDIPLVQITYSRFSWKEMSIYKKKNIFYKEVIKYTQNEKNLELLLEIQQLWSICTEWQIQIFF